MRIFIYCVTADKIQDGGYFIYDILKVFIRHDYDCQPMLLYALESQTWAPNYDNFNGVII